MKARRTLKGFRWSPKTLKTLRAEAKRTGRTQTSILERAFGYFMAHKAEGRERILTPNAK